jgi:hypothetical protein
MDILSSFFSIMQRLKKDAGPMLFLSLFLFSLHYQAREIDSFNAISLFGLSLVSFSIVPSTA